MADTAGANALTFHETTFDLVEHTSGGIWLRYPQLAGALGYDRADRVLDVHNRNAAEFTDSMTALVKLPTAGGVQEVRIFSLRGAHLLGMFARTKRAAEFRKWVLDVLERQAPPAALPAPGAPALIGQTLERVTAERDALRKVVAKSDPLYARALRYHAIPGLNHIEKARLMGWKTPDSWRQCLREMAALGLVDYTPNLGHKAAGLAAMASGHMAKMRAARTAKLAAKRDAEEAGNV